MGVSPLDPRAVIAVGEEIGGGRASGKPRYAANALGEDLSTRPPCGGLLTADREVDAGHTISESQSLRLHRCQYMRLHIYMYTDLDLDVYIWDIYLSISRVRRSREHCGV